MSSISGKPEGWVRGDYSAARSRGQQAIQKQPAEAGALTDPHALKLPTASNVDKKTFTTSHTTTRSLSLSFSNSRIGSALQRLSSSASQSARTSPLMGVLKQALTRSFSQKNIGKPTANPAKLTTVDTYKKGCAAITEIVNKSDTPLFQKFSSIFNNEETKNAFLIASQTQHVTDSSDFIAAYMNYKGNPTKEGAKELLKHIDPKSPNSVALQESKYGEIQNELAKSKNAYIESVVTYSFDQCFNEVASALQQNFQSQGFPNLKGEFTDPKAQMDEYLHTNKGESLDRAFTRILENPSTKREFEKFAKKTIC